MLKGRPATMLKIEITLPSGETQQHRFGDSALSIGRMLGQVQIQDPGVSALHGQITIEDGEVSYRDLGSAQGSFLPDGTPIRYTVPMTPGDKVHLGGHQLALIEFSDPEQSKPPPKPPASPVVIAASPEGETRPKRRKRAVLPRRKAKPPQESESEAKPPQAAKTEVKPPQVAKTEVKPPQSAQSDLDPPAAPDPKNLDARREAIRSMRTSKENSTRREGTRPSKDQALRRISAKQGRTPDRPGGPQAGLNPAIQTTIQYAGRERSAPRVDPQTWVDAKQCAPTLSQSVSMARSSFGPLLGSGPLLIMALGLFAAAAAVLFQLSAPFWALSLLLLYVVSAHAVCVWGLSIVEFLSEARIRPHNSWKQVSSLAVSTRLSLFVGLLLSLALPPLSPYILPSSLLEKRTVGGALKRSAALLRSNLLTSIKSFLPLALSLSASAAGAVAALYYLPDILGKALALSVAVLGVVLTCLFAMVWSLHAFRVYFWHRAQENPNAPELRPARLLPING